MYQIKDRLKKLGKTQVWLIFQLEHLENIMALLPPTMKPYAVMISGKMTSKKGKGSFH